MQAQAGNLPTDPMLRNGPTVDHAVIDALFAPAEQQVAWGFALLAASVVLLVVAVVVLSVRARMSSGPLAVAAIGLVMLLSAAMTSFLQLMPLAPVLPPELLQIIGQLLLVGVILYAIGGVRFDSKRLARPGHRHDVEGGVELVES